MTDVLSPSERASALQESLTAIRAVSNFRAEVLQPEKKDGTLYGPVTVRLMRGAVYLMEASAVERQANLLRESIEDIVKGYRNKIRKDLKSHLTNLDDSKVNVVVTLGDGLMHLNHPTVVVQQTRDQFAHITLNPEWCYVAVDGSDARVMREKLDEAMRWFREAALQDLAKDMRMRLGDD